MPHEPFRPHMAVIRGVQSPRDKIVLARGHYPCPGCALDPLNGKHKFHRWHARPQSARRLYWRVRPALYQLMMEGWK